MVNKRVSLQLKHLAGFTALALLFQNCTPNHLVIDEDLKTNLLASNKILTSSSPDEESKIVGFTFVCPQTGKDQPKDLLHSGELKAVVEKYDFDSNTSTVLCEIHGVRKQILDSRSVDLSNCEEIPGPQNAHLDLYIVEESITKNFRQHKINIDTTPLALGGYSLNYLAMNPEAKNSACDEAGAPLMIQLGNSTTTITLTAPSDGVKLDLLGGKSYQNPHDQVLTSWPTPNSANDVYVLVKPNRDHLVLGADEMFADTTLGPDTKYAKQGFAALAKYDDNKDQMITAEDVVFSELRLWKDSNHDGRIQENELSTLSEMKILALDLRYETQYRETDAYGNQSRYKSVVVMEDQSYGMIFDLWLRFIHKTPPPEIAKPAPAQVSADAGAADSSDDHEPLTADQNPADTNSQTNELHEEAPQPDSAPSVAEPEE